MAQISLGRTNSDDYLEPITPTNLVEQCTVIELPMQNVNTAIRVCFSVYPSFLARRPRATSS